MDKRFTLTREQHDFINRKMEERYPTPKTPPVPYAVSGFFGGGLIAYLTLLVTGQEETQQGAYVIVAILCGGAGHLYEKMKDKEQRKYLEQLERSFRKEWESNQGH